MFRILDTNFGKNIFFRTSIKVGFYGRAPILCEHSEHFLFSFDVRSDKNRSFIAYFILGWSNIDLEKDINNQYIDININTSEI